MKILKTFYIPHAVSMAAAMVAAAVVAFQTSALAEGPVNERILLARVSPGERLPDFSLPLPGKKEEIRPERLEGKPTVLAFFAFDTEARKSRSLKMLSIMSALKKKYAGRAAFYGVLAEPGLAERERQIRDAGIDMDILDDGERKAYADLGIFMMPVALVVSPTRILLERIPLNEGFEASLETWIRVALGEVKQEALPKLLKPEPPPPISEAEKEYIKVVGLARVLVKRKMYPQAVEQYRQALTLMPGQEETLLEMGNALLKMKDPATAERVFTDILAKSPGNLMAVSGLGLALHAQGKDSEALPELVEAAASLRPLPEVLVALAEIYIKEGKKDEALSMYKRAVERLQTIVDRLSPEVLPEGNAPPAEPGSPR